MFCVEMKTFGLYKKDWRSYLMLISGEHLQSIFASQELDKDSVIRIFRNTAADSKQYPTQFYNLDAIIAIGYRVNSNIIQSMGYESFEDQRICIR